MAELLLASDPKSISPDNYRKLMRNFLELNEYEQLEELAMAECRADEHLSFSVSAYDLINYDSALAFNILYYPKLLMEIFNEALYQSLKELIGHTILVKKYNRPGTLKKYCNIRIHSLPCVPDLSKPTIGSIKSSDVDSLIQICGTVVRTSSVRMLIVSKQYQCMNAKCGFRFKVVVDPEQGNILPTPRCCPSGSSSQLLPGGFKCNSVNIREVEGSSECVDYQEIKVQDQIERLPFGNMPRSVTVILEADLVDKFNPGDDVVIVGNLIRRWRPVFKGSRCQIDMAVKANSVRNAKSSLQKQIAINDSYGLFASFWSYHENRKSVLKGRNIIIKAVCPQLHGLYYVKLCLLLTLIGGSSSMSVGESGNTSADDSHMSTQDARGTQRGSNEITKPSKRRAQGHLLIVGDPGTGKSQLLRFACSVLPRSVLTTGVGTTSAGLTCSAVRSGNEWTIDAGALVLANDGVCCIDEFASIREQDRGTIHEAMEQQTISVAKAGMVMKLNTRCSVIAVCNPKGNYDINSDITVNTAIAAPLISRFDLVLVLLDLPQKDWDMKISTFLLQQATYSGDKKRSDQNSSNQDADMKSSKWSFDLLKKYVLLVRERFSPRISDEARCVLMRYYQLQRQKDDRSSSRTTVRLLESLMRLAEAHAKLMFRNLVTLQDGVIAISCLEVSSTMNSSPFAGGVSTSPLHLDFPAQPDEDYGVLEQQVFAKMQYNRAALKRDCANGTLPDETQVQHGTSITTKAMITDSSRGVEIIADNFNDVVSSSFASDEITVVNKRNATKRRLTDETSKHSFDDVDDKSSKLIFHNRSAANEESLRFKKTDDIAVVAFDQSNDSDDKYFGSSNIVFNDMQTLSTAMHQKSLDFSKHREEDFNSKPSEDSMWGKAEIFEVGKAHNSIDNSLLSLSEESMHITSEHSSKGTIRHRNNTSSSTKDHVGNIKQPHIDSVFDVGEVFRSFPTNIAVVDEGNSKSSCGPSHAPLSVGNFWNKAVFNSSALEKILDDDIDMW